MPGRPATSGYARIAQAEEEEDVDQDLTDEEDPYAFQNTLHGDTRYAPIQPKRRDRMHTPDGSASGSRQPLQGRRRRTNSGVDIKAINARLEKWADEIAQKFKIRKVKGKSQEEEHLEIHHSVFQAPDWIRPATAETLAAVDDEPSPDRITKDDFEDIVESVRVAIEMDIQPKLIAQGSSGSYFARNTAGKVVGVFKPKDEEPYASKNPKWTKWIHRNLFPFFFGRACLIPNLSYVSEAAAYVLDNRLRTNLVPYTDIVSLSSDAFFYDFWDRRAHRKGKPFPAKQGSFQVFLKGFKDANIFLKEHPWPDQHNSSLRTDGTPKKRKSRGFGQWSDDCRPRAPHSDDEDDGLGEQPSYRQRSRQRNVFWTDTLQQSFREQLEKLVILDYIMRNTDRGLDNWMIRIDQKTQEATIVLEPPNREGANGRTNGHSDPYQRQEHMSTSGNQRSPTSSNAKVTIGAIDNSLSWPWKHPDAWRSFPFGWLFLPVSLIGHPFTEKTKQHFLPLLTSKQWWSETQVALRQCFEQDSDFQEKMFARQIAVMKGQAWNVVETLKTPDHGPLELTRRARVCVWDDLVEIPVAVPMRPPSDDIRRKMADTRTRSKDIVEEEEMDISAAYASAPQPNHDLLGLHLNRAKPNRFNISRQNSSDIGMSEDDAPLSPSSVQGFSFDASNGSQLPRRPTNKSRLSYDEPKRLFDNLGERKRRFSFAIGGKPGGAVSTVEDELEGDLGYAAAEDQEGNRRKVIVERLEMVKGRNPVFTWC